MNQQVDTHHQDWLAQAEIYALGALNGDERVAFEAHLAAGCSLCEEHIRKTQEALTLLPQALELVAPPPVVKERLLAQIAAEADRPQPVRQSPSRRWWWMGISALAAASLLLGLSITLYQSWQESQHLRDQLASLQTAFSEREQALTAERRELQRVSDRLASLQAELARREETLEAELRARERVERTVATLQDELVEREAALRLLATPKISLVRLAGQPPSPRAHAHLAWNPAAQTGVLLTSGLRPIPRDRVYELWAFAGNEPVPAGIFQVDEAGHGFLRLSPLPTGKRYGKFAVTSEPAGGVPKPTGPVHLLGSL
jgi:hypothetical protein